MIIECFGFIFGAMVGSFLNVLIYRLPKEIDFIFKRSHCPNCNYYFPFYCNIPIISYIFLLGKCLKCKSRIGLRYPLTELLFGVAGVYFAPEHLSVHDIALSLFYFSIVCVFYCHFLIDLKHYILPDELNIYLALIFLIYGISYLPWTHYVTGGLIGLLLPLGATYLFYLVRGQVGLGGGDIKLYGALGIYLGPFGVLQNIFFSCFTGSIIGITLILLKKMDKNNPMPFGPAIILAATFQIFFPSYAKKLVFYLFAL